MIKSSLFGRRNRRIETNKRGRTNPRAQTHDGGRRNPQAQVKCITAIKSFASNQMLPRTSCIDFFPNPNFHFYWLFETCRWTFSADPTHRKSKNWPLPLQTIELDRGTGKAREQIQVSTICAARACILICYYAANCALNCDHILRLHRSTLVCDAVLLTTLRAKRSPVKRRFVCTGDLR